MNTGLELLFFGTKLGFAIMQEISKIDSLNEPSFNFLGGRGDNLNVNFGFGFLGNIDHHFIITSFFNRLS